METFARLTPPESRLQAERFRWACAAAVVALIVLLLVLKCFPPDRPVDYASDLDHFYYGSIGSDISGGLPLKVVQVLPKMFPELLPAGTKQGDYTAFGFVQQPGHAMPIGFSVRRRFIDLTAINCAACHTGTVREAADKPPQIIAAMPANTVNLLAFFRFLFACAADERFNSRDILAAMREVGLAEPLDGPVYSVVVPRLKTALLDRAAKLKFLTEPDYPPFGPGRVDTFDTFKFDQFHDYYQAHNEAITADEIYGTVDFPSIWNQQVREGLSLHWDGNNTSVRERNFSAAIGAGAKPPDIDIPRLFRVEAWLRTLPAPAYPFAIDEAEAQRGEAIYRQYCYDCHDLGGKRVGTVIPLAEIGTDRHRLDSYTPFLLAAQQDYTKGYFWAFNHFRKTDGYAAPPLDGIWARAPYLHNGSVPTLWDLFSPDHDRPRAFTIGGDIYDQEHLGFQHDVLIGSSADGYKHLEGSPYQGTAFVLDTGLTGNSRDGHSGEAYGTQLSDDDKRALIEYFKWQDRPRDH